MDITDIMVMGMVTDIKVMEVTEIMVMEVTDMVLDMDMDMNMDMDTDILIIMNLLCIIQHLYTMKPKYQSYTILQLEFTTR